MRDSSLLSFYAGGEGGVCVVNVRLIYVNNPIFKNYSKTNYLEPFWLQL